MSDVSDKSPQKLVDELNLEKMRHSAEHVLTVAMLRLYGPDKIKMAMGPATKDGFYFDFEGADDFALAEEALPKIQKEMTKIIGANWEFCSFPVPSSEALEFFPYNPYKRELITDLISEQGQSEVTFYVLAPADKMKTLDSKWWLDTTWEKLWEQGYFVDLCKGPHVEKTNQIKAVSLLSIAGAYWRGDEKRQMLTRIYGTAFNSQKELDDYLIFLEEVKKRDHKKLGRQLDLFSFHPESPGMVFWHAKGMTVWDALENFGQKIRSEHGFIKIKTPEMAKNSLWITSGHWSHYKDDMFVFDVDDETYCLKPMDCPFNIKIYQTSQKSYRDLPVRYTEIGHIFRNEKSGELNGLFRAREFTQDDSHVLCTERQIQDEIVNLLSAVKEYYLRLGLVPTYYLSTMPDDHLGEEATWNRAEADLIQALEKEDINYELKAKDGAFYGPKIDIDIADSLGRKWQVATIQLDFQLPGRFGCEYIDESGQKRTPVMLHSAIFGSFERMIGILLEHYAGALPTWLSPVQVEILPIADRHLARAEAIAGELRGQGVRVELDSRSERLPAKIRDAQLQKVPYMLIIGDAEVEEGTVAVRERDGQEKKGVKINDLVELIKKS